MDPFSRLRQEFSIVERTTYLASQQLGAMPRKARAALTSFADSWESQGALAWSADWRAASQRVVELLAALLHTTAAQITLQPDLYAAFSSSLPARGPYKLVVEEQLTPYLSLHQGSALVSVPTQGGLSLNTHKLLEAIDQETGYIALSHTSYTSALQELAPIAQKAQEVGAALVLDVTGSAGTVELDAEALGLSAMIGDCAGWLCGGPGTSFLWSKEPRPQAPPTQAPNIAAHLSAEVGLKIITQLGVAAIRARSTRQSQRLIDGVLARGWQTKTPKQPERRGGLVAMLPPYPYEVSRALIERSFLIDYHPVAGICVSPHFYNLDSELDALLSQMDDIIDRRDYERFTLRRKPGA